MGKIKTASLFIIGALAAVAYFLFRGGKAKAAPASPGGESVAEKTAMTTFTATQTTNAILQQTYESVRTLPPVSLTPTNTERIEAAALALDQANALAATYASQSEALAVQLAALTSQMNVATYEEYDSLLLQYQSLRTQQINVLTQYELARADALRAGTLYSQIRAGLA